jgi:nitroreductase
MRRSYDRLAQAEDARIFHFDTKPFPGLTTRGRKPPCKAGKAYYKEQIAQNHREKSHFPLNITTSFLLFSSWLVCPADCVQVPNRIDCGNFSKKSRVFAQKMLCENRRERMKNFSGFAKGRHSGRAMSGKKVTSRELRLLFEAARWAPSAHNLQPWHFVYVVRETHDWEMFLDLLCPFNREWAEDAAVLVVVAAHTQEDGERNRYADFDVGAACQNLALQAEALGLSVCMIGGFSRTRARRLAKVPSEYQIPVMIAIGRSRRVKSKVSRRAALSRLVSKGAFGKQAGI